MKLKKTLQITFLFLLTCLPSLVFAYSPYVIPGGENLGIELKTKYVTVVGFYKVNNKYIAEETGFQIGDLITSINGKEVTSVDSLITLVDEYKENSEIPVSILRSGKKTSTNLAVEKDSSGIYKTGLYVKDTINGIGTLTYIDPSTSIYGALGHEIADKNTLLKVEIKNGEIFESSVTEIVPSRDGDPGEKKAALQKEEVYGNILKNEESGIFGTFTSEVPAKDAIEVCEPEDVKRGKASIRTVISKDEVEEFEIEILEVDLTSDTKNMLFKITDDRLLQETGGVVAGMSGSPIIQNGKLIGAVTHVVVNDTNKGYGIFITTMLEEGEKEDA